jgi:hypothetical protein
MGRASGDKGWMDGDFRALVLAGTLYHAARFGYHARTRVFLV